MYVCRHRLVWPRTHGSHPCNWGSNPDVGHTITSLFYYFCYTEKQILLFERRIMSMPDSRVTYDTLKKIKAIVSGHFQYSDGTHGSIYVNHKAIFQNPNDANMLAFMLARRFVNDNIEVIIGPKDGGASLAERMAERLGSICCSVVVPLAAQKNCLHCEGGGFSLDEDTSILLRGKRTLVVDDIGKAGTAVREVIGLSRAASGKVIAVGYICNRGGLTAGSFLGVKRYETLLDFPLESYDAADCEQCKQGISINTRFGHGASQQMVLKLPKA